MPRPKLSSPPLLVVLLSLILLQQQYHSSDARSVRSGMPVIPAICHKPPPRSEGICTIEIEGYYYEPAALDCLPYSVGACRLTPGQTFGSQMDCVRTCISGERQYSHSYVNV